jgi:hypothetical protein
MNTANRIGIAVVLFAAAALLILDVARYYMPVPGLLAAVTWGLIIAGLLLIGVCEIKARVADRLSKGQARRPAASDGLAADGEPGAAGGGDGGGPGITVKRIGAAVVFFAAAALLILDLARYYIPVPNLFAAVTRGLIIAGLLWIGVCEIQARVADRLSRGTNGTDGTKESH